MSIRAAIHHLTHYKYDRPVSLGPQIIEADIVENVDQERVLWEKQDLLRHDPAKLAHIIMELR